MLKNKNVTIVVVLLIGLMSVGSASAVNGPLIFDWGVREFQLAGFEEVTPVPHPGHDYPADHEYYVNLYNQLYAADKPLCLMLQPDANPIDGVYMYALQTVMGYAPRLNIVFADFEDVNQNAQTLEMISQVRTNSNPLINTAYVGNYADFPGVMDYSEIWPAGVDRTARSNFYTTSGTNLATPNCYPYEYQEVHTWPSIWGTNVSPNKRSALFWAPLERMSVAKRALPAGHLLIPWTARFIGWEGYDAPTPTREDVIAIIGHMRLRGADGYYRLVSIDRPGVTIDPNEETQNRMDMLKAWQSLDKVFEDAGAVTILNLNTNKTGGIEWSGVQHGNKIAILISNLGNSAASVALPAGYGLPANSDVIAAGSHQLKIYTTILPSEDTCVKTNGTLTNALYTSYNAGSTDVANYLKFNLADIVSPKDFKSSLYSAKLVTNAPARIGAAYTDAIFSVYNDSWTEAGLTWANKPAVISQLSSWTTLASPATITIDAAELKAFVAQQANGDANASFCVKDLNASKTSTQYQQYPDSDADTANCFKLVVEYTPVLVMSSLPETEVAAPNQYATVSAGYGGRHTALLRVGYFYSTEPTQTFLKYDLTSAIDVPAGMTAVVTSASIKAFALSLTGPEFTEYLYSVTNDDWLMASVNWATRPDHGEALDSGPVPESWASNVTLFESSELTDFVGQEVNGDKIITVMIEGTDAEFIDQSIPCIEYNGDYYNIQFSPRLELTYHFETLLPPINCQEAIERNYGLKADLNSDCYVNLQDFALFALEWLK